MKNKRIDLDQIIESVQNEELNKRNVKVLSKDFSDNQITAIAKAVLYIISSDGVITDEEKSFFTKLCTDLKVGIDIMERAVSLSDEAMFDSLETVSDDQGAYILTCFNDAAYADNELAEEERKLIDTFSSHIQKRERPKDFYTKILTF